MGAKVNETSKRKISEIFLSFSVIKNWKTLIEPANKNFINLQPLDGLRAYFVSGIIFSHTNTYIRCLSFVYGEVNIEDSALGFSVSTFSVQTFFVLAGFLTAYVFLNEVAKVDKINFRLFFIGIARRYARFAPMAAIVTLIHATLLYRLGDGFLWNVAVFRERHNCRTNWWQNMLFVTNYVQMDEMCVGPLWYLSCDFWLRIGAIISLILMHKYQKLRYWIPSAIIAVSVLTVGIGVYMEKNPDSPILTR